MRFIFLILLTSLLTFLFLISCSDNPVTTKTQLWSPLGRGVNDQIYSITVYNNQLIAGGQFTKAGDDSANHIAQWNGSFWSPLGSGISYPGFPDAVLSLTVFNNQLIAGGAFTSAGGTNANDIAKWDGSSWSSLGNGTNCNIYALTEYNGKLIAGGCFTIAGTDSARCIAQWDGSSWSSLGNGMSGTNTTVVVRALIVYNGKLIAGGNFAIAGTDSANYIAQWDGSSWSSLGSGINYLILSLTLYNNKLIAGGMFTTAGGNNANNIAQWDGSSWSSLSSGTNGAVFSLTVYNNQLTAGGEFTTAGGISANNIAKWDGNSWSPLGSGLSNAPIGTCVFALTAYNDVLIAGGGFSIAGTDSLKNIAQWH